MGYVDFSRHVHDVAVNAISAITTLHAAPIDHGAPPPAHADFADNLTSSWESAWIDLGGEG